MHWIGSIHRRVRDAVCPDIGCVTIVWARFIFMVPELVPGAVKFAEITFVLLVAETRRLLMTCSVWHIMKVSSGNVCML